MGLAISRSIVEAHSGKLWARPNTGRGVTFGFTLPCDSRVVTEGGQSTIFIVDDETAVRDSLCFVLQGMGLTVRSFASAIEFLAFFEPYCIAGPVCLVADIQMPEVSGIDLLEHLRKLGKEIPTIIATGHGDTALKQKAKELGAVAFLEKPYRIPQLEDAISTCLKTDADEQHAA